VALGRGGTAARSGGSAERAASQRQTTIAESTTKTARPSQRFNAAAATMSAKYPIVSRRKRYASASLENGFLAMSPLA
jgi:hypothetical protein